MMKFGLPLLLSLWCFDALAAPTIAMGEARLRALNKQTGRASDLVIAVGEATLFEHLAIEVKACYTAPDFMTPENSAFIRVLEIPSGTRGTNTSRVRGRQIFSGWIFSSSPSLSALEHPHYDIWLTLCANPRSAPVAATAVSAAVPDEE
jgi:hypothetical protein